MGSAFEHEFPEQARALEAIRRGLFGDFGEHLSALAGQRAHAEGIDFRLALQRVVRERPVLAKAWRRESRSKETSK